MAYEYEFDGVKYATPNRLSDLQVENLVSSYREAGLTHPTAVEQQRLAREDLLQNKSIKDSFQKYWMRENGTAFDGTDDELVSEYMEQMRYWDLNLGSLFTLGAKLEGNYYTEDERQAIGVLWNTWQNVVPFTQQEGHKWDAAWDFVEAAGTDVTNWAGLVTGGTATAGSLVAKQAAKAGIRKLIFEGMKSGGKAGAIQGAGWSAAHSITRQNAQAEVGIGDGVDFKETAVDTAIGTVIGAGIGVPLGGTLGAVKGLRGPKAATPDEMLPTETPPTSSLWDAPEQAITSADTSINSGKLPAGYNKLKQMGVFQEGQVVADIGGGRFDNAVDDLAKDGVEVLVFDPFNRTATHNTAVATRIQDGGANVAVSNNVLNVIEEPANIAKVIQQAENAISTGDKAYFTVYQGNKTGVGTQTSKGYQRNEPTANYMEAVESVFGKGNVQRKGDVIIATKATASTKPTQAARTNISEAQAAEKWMQVLSDDSITGSARDAARKVFITEMGKGIQNQGAGVSKTNDQVFNEAMQRLTALGVKTFEPDEVIARMWNAKQQGRMGMNVDQFASLANSVENFAWQRFRTAVKENDPKTVKFWDDYAKAAETASGVSTEVGRALQLQSLRGRTDPITFAEALDFIANKAQTPKEAALIAEKAAQKAGVWRKMTAGLNEFFINNILGATVTLTVNVTSGVVHHADRALTSMVAGVSTKNGKLVRDGATQFLMQYYYIGSALRYGLKAFAKADAQLDKGRNFVDDATQSIAIGNRNFDLSKPSTLLPQGEGALQYGMNWVGNLNRVLGSRAMIATDELMKQMSFRAKLFELEVNDFMAKGSTWTEAVKLAQQSTAKKTEDYIDSVGQGVAVLDVNSKKALQEAREITFQTEFKDDAFGRAGKFTQDLVNKVPISRQVMPFIRTPTNILSYVGEKTAFLQNTSKSFKERLSSSDPKVRAKAQTSLHLGTLFWAGATMTASSGALTSVGPSEFSERNVKNISKEYLPYSLRTGDTSVQIRRWDPWAKFFVVMGAVHDTYKYASVDSQNAMFARSALAIAEALFSMPATQSVQAMMNAFRSDEASLDTFMGKQAQSFFPYYRLWQEIAEMQGMDKVIYEQFDMSDLAKDPILLFETKWPFISEEKKSQIDRKRDPIFGEPQVVQPNLGLAISGLAYKEGTDTRVIEELMRLGVGKQPPSPLQGGADMRLFPVEPEYQRTVYDLFQEMVGTVEIGGKNLYQTLEGTIKSDAYLQVMTDNSALVGRSEATGSREQTISSIISEYRTYAHYQLVEKLLKQDKNHPYVQLSRREQLRKELNKTQQTQSQSDQIMNSVLGPLGNNQ